MESLESWVKRISEQELPIFKYTVNSINEVVANDETSTSDLSQIILKDANLTARILRVANSAMYNPTGSPISTISRAIVFIGFKLVRDISMSLAIIDALLGKHAKEKGMRLMAKSFHTAVQARNFAEQRGDSATEEIFIAALLSQLGEMAFWCVDLDKAEQIVKLEEEKGFSADMAQKELLGFTYDQLTVGLTQDWQLSDLLHSSINNPKLQNPRVQDIVLSRKLAEATEHGWEEHKLKPVREKISAHLKLESEPTQKLLEQNLEKAVEFAHLFGASAIIQYLPLLNLEPAAEELDESLGNPDCPEPDPLLQLNILRDLSGMLDSKPSFTLILEVVLEGIFRGVGMDRALFALLTTDKKLVKGRYALGRDSGQLVTEFQFDIASNPLFSDVLRNGSAIWIKDSQDKALAAQIPVQLRMTLASKAFYLCPIIVNKQAIGLIYADRKTSGRALDVQSFESFKHFCQQACLAISHMSARR